MATQDEAWDDSGYPSINDNVFNELLEDVEVTEEDVELYGDDNYISEEQAAQAQAEEIIRLGDKEYTTTDLAAQLAEIEELRRNSLDDNSRRIS